MYLCVLITVTLSYFQFPLYVNRFFLCHAIFFNYYKDQGYRMFSILSIFQNDGSISCIFQLHTRLPNNMLSIE